MFPEIAVLMSTYNGERYIDQQIRSILTQERVHVHLFIRDDGSTDDTLDIIGNYAKYNSVNFYSGDNKGSAMSFLDLLEKTKGYPYYAFADQDDIWYPDKLERAIRLLDKKSVSSPALYCSDYQLVDQWGNKLKDNGHQSAVTFGGALVSGCCTGCTVVFNKALHDIVITKTPRVILMHDDWIHKVCLGVGGNVIYDDWKSLDYRQHGDNVDGGVHPLGQRLISVIRRIFRPDRVRSQQLHELSRLFGEKFTEENYKLLNKLCNYVDLNIVARYRLTCDPRLKATRKQLQKGFQMAILLKYF